MNSKFLFSLLIALTFTALTQAQPVPRGKGSFKFYSGAAIQVTNDDKGRPYEFKIVKGKNTVFEYTYIAADDSLIADDEYRETIVFEIAGTSKKSFRFQGAELSKINCFYYWSCFCPNAGTHLVENGQLSGQRYGRKKWLISLEATVLNPEFPDWPKKKEFSRQYFMRDTLKTK